MAASTTLKVAHRLPSPGWLRVLAFLAALGWIFVRGLTSNVETLPPVSIPLIGFALVSTAVAFMIGMWSQPGYDWIPEHRLVVVAGPLLASWLLGFAVAAAVGFFPPLDLLGQLGFDLLAYLGLRRLRRNVKVQSTQQGSLSEADSQHEGIPA